MTTTEWMLSKTDTLPVGFKTQLHKADTSITVVLVSERISRAFNPVRKQFQPQAIRTWKVA